MRIILWSITALFAGLLVTTAAARTAHRRQPGLPPGESLPATPLQRLARWGLAVGLLLSAAAVGAIAYVGPMTFYENDRVRLGITALLLAALAVFLGFALRVRSLAAQDDGTLDERDRAILDRAPSAQSGAMLVTLAVWIIGLQEVFSSTKLVPTAYLYLIFWSCILVSLLALPVGILLGYRRS